MIIILTQCFPPTIGGIENLVENLSIELSKTYKVLVLADDHDKKNDNYYDSKHDTNLVIKRISGIKFFRKRKKLTELKKLLSSNKVSHVIGDSWKSFELTIDTLNSQSIPSICLAHGNELIIKNSSKKIRVVSILNKVKHIVTNSNFTARLIKNIGITNQNITCIYPGANNTIHLNEENISNINGQPVITTLARLEKRKGHAYILSVVARLKLEYPNILYIIAGSGVELENLKKITLELDIVKNIIFLGDINENQKKFVFKNTNLMVMPTLDESKKHSIEGFGIAYLEAAYYGIPSIASKVGGTPEAVIHNETGIIISDMSELYNSLKELLSNKSKLNELGQKAKLRAENDFTWVAIGNKYLQLIKNLDN
ncbi:glycosyltransferase family 4 protein [Alphaproteobacteria bacterium]|nr:glycosyltransferase family 4 protein [Alphaproteobacteria bacterium]MDC3270330.1 glycosyltransferase family 4 protein [Alphaproteobacteria bacterium]